MQIATWLKSRRASSLLLAAGVSLSLFIAIFAIISAIQNRPYSTQAADTTSASTDTAFPSLTAKKAIFVGATIDRNSVDLGTMGSTALVGNSTVAVTTNSVAGYTITQTFDNSATATTTASTSSVSTARWTPDGVLRLDRTDEDVTIPVTVNHSFGQQTANTVDNSYLEPNTFIYAVSPIDTTSTPAGTYKATSEYSVVANMPAAPTGLALSPTEYKIGSADKTLKVTAASGLNAVYSIYIGDSSQACTIDSTTRTDTEISCTIPDTIAKGEYEVYLISQASTDPQSAGKLTVTKPCYFSTTATAGNSDALQVDYDCNMIPVKYTGDSVTPQWTVADPTSSNASDWFSYDSTNKQWANVVTVKKDALTKYSTAGNVEKSGQAPAKGYYKAGTTVDNSDVLGYFVYVPRYKYKVMTMSGSTTSTATNFEIQFEKNSATKSVPSAVGDWATHPAFTWGDTELNGFWMGKFETTGKISTPTVKPNQVANISNTIGEQFTSAASIGVDDPAADTMGSSISGITKNGHNLLAATSHTLKNGEWGAAAYLSASEFGAGVNNVLNNGAYNHKSNSNTSSVNSDADGNSASRWGGAATGCGTSSDSDTYNSDGYYFPQHTTTLNSTTLQYDDAMDGGSVCEKGSSDTTHAYNQSLGVKASTTNNVYGIYDMAGGMWEYVMGNYTDTAGKAHESTYSYAKGSIGNGFSEPYVDFYLNLTSSSSCTWTTCGGAALYETGSWSTASSSFVDSDYPWLVRGGSTFYGQNADVFASYNSIGNANSNDGFRVGLLVPASTQ